jgi:hypothetical protein
VQGSHYGGEPTRCAGGGLYVKKVEQRSGANCVLISHSSFYLFKERGFMMRFQLGAGLSQLPE